MIPAPACCAGLRQTLLHEGQQDFPLQESPFQLVSRRLGVSVREVLHHCQVLHDEGAVDGIRLHWAARMLAVRWRLLYRLPAPPGPQWEAALLPLPGVAEYFVGEPLSTDTPELDDGSAAWLWFDIVAHRLPDAQRQRALLESRAGHADSCLAIEQAGMEPAEAGGEPAVPGCPCGDEPLAREAEALLPLATHPYRPIASALGRSEREVIAVLRRWRLAGYLAGASFVRGDEPAALSGLVAVLPRLDADADLPGRLMARAGIQAVQRFSGEPRWGWLVTASGAPLQAQHTLERALAACAVPPPYRLLRVRRTRVRHAPLLFSAPPS